MTAPSDIHHILGENIRRLLFELHMTQEMLAKKAGLQRSSVYTILKGGNPRLGTIEAIARTLGVSVESLLVKYDHGHQTAEASQAKTDKIIDVLSLLLNAAKVK